MTNNVEATKRANVEELNNTAKAERTEDVYEHNISRVVFRAYRDKI